MTQQQGGLHTAPHGFDVSLSMADHCVRYLVFACWFVIVSPGLPDQRRRQGRCVQLYTEIKSMSW